MQEVFTRLNVLKLFFTQQEDRNVGSIAVINDMILNTDQCIKKIKRDNACVKPSSK